MKNKLNLLAWPLTTLITFGTIFYLESCKVVKNPEPTGLESINLLKRQPYVQIVYPSEGVRCAVMWAPYADQDVAMQCDWNYNDTK